MSSSYRQELDRWLAQLDVKANRVLDIGGAQLPVKGRTKSWNVEEYLIADLPQPHVGSPKPDIELDVNTTPMVADQYGEYDLIFCLEVFEYVFNPLDAFRRIKSLLKDDGTAWVTFPSFYPAHQPIEDDSLRYMEGGIRKLADSVGLKIVEMIKRRPETTLLEQFFRAERMRAAKDYNHEFTGWIVRFTANELR